MIAIERYLDELRGELAVQFRRADIDRVVEEVESHLLVAIEEAEATSEADIEAVLERFGSPTTIGSAYRRTELRAIEAPTDGNVAADASARRDPLSRTSIRSRILIGDLMNLNQIIRNLVRNPGFAAVTIGTLALGIAANAVILGVVNGVLLEPLPFPDADRLVRVYHDAPGLNLDLDDIGLSVATYFYFRDQGVLEDLAIYNTGAANISGDEEPRRVNSVSVSHSFFNTLGVPPIVGRTFNEDDEQPDAPEVVLLSESLWRNSFGARTDVVGETIIKDSESAEIIGVVPQITFPDPEVGIYEVMTLPRTPGTLGSLGTDSVGRMPPGMTVEEAGAQFAARIADVEEAMPDEPAAPILAQAGFTAHAVGLKESLVVNIERDLWILMGSVGFVLLIACANVANVFLVRAEGREREMAVRAALGAGRGRLALGFLAESATLGLIAGAVGLLLAFAGVQALLRMGSQRLPRAEQIGIDPTVIIATLLLGLLTGLLFGVLPTLRYRASWLAAALKEGGRSNTAGRSRFHLRSALVAAQVALALVLLVGSGLMVRSYASLAAVDPGFDPESMLTFRVMLNRTDYPDEEAPAQFIQRLLDDLAGMPGVVSAAATNAPPLTNSVSGGGFAIEDRPLGEGDLPPVHVFKFVSADYFETMGIPLVAGRTIERADHEERRNAVVVNETFARLYWPDEDPIGRRIQQGGGAEPNPDTWYRIVGVVGDTRGNGPPTAAGTGLLEGEPVAVAYYPLVAIYREDEDGNRASPNFANSVRNPVFLVRTDGGPTALVEPIRQRILELDANLPIASVRTMEDIVDRAMVQKSFTMMLLLVGAVGALLIGAVGIYGVISYVVAQQTREIGVRMALGARTEDIGRMVLRRSLLISGGGIVAGLLGAFALTRFMASLLFGVDPLDPLTFGAVIVTLLAVASLAGYLPARRAAHVDPMEALRRE